MSRKILPTNTAGYFCGPPSTAFHLKFHLFLVQFLTPIPCPQTHQILTIVKIISSDLLIDCLWFFFPVTKFISFPKQQLEDLPLKRSGTKGRTSLFSSWLACELSGGVLHYRNSSGRAVFSVLWLQQSGTWNLLLQLFFTKRLPLSNEYWGGGAVSLFNLYCFPNSEVKVVGFGELGCNVGQFLLACERVPVLLLLNAWSITGSKIYRILK